MLTETDSPESATITYTYDGEGREHTLAVSGQPTVTYTWNNAHQITNVTNGTLSATIGYDSAGRRNSLTLPNGVTVSYTYDNGGHGDNRITEIDYYANNRLLGNLTYTYDAGGRIVGKGVSLATINLPAVTTANATYNGDNTLLTWNGVRASHDLARI